MNVDWSDEARDELSIIYRDLERVSLDRAIHAVSRLTEASVRLRDFPEMGRVASGYGAAGLREVLVDRYRLIYFLHPTKVEIIAIRYQ